MKRRNIHLLFLAVLLTGCIPIPVPTSTVMFHPREQLPPATATSDAIKYSQYVLPTFDRNGERLAVYDWRSDEIKILRTRDLAHLMSLKPSRWPKKIYFSPEGNYIVVLTEGDWVDKGMRMKQPPIQGHVDINSPEAILDWIEQVEIWDIKKNHKIKEACCDDVISIKPEGGWLWASNWTIRPGLKRSMIHDSKVSDDGNRLSLLCQNGVIQHWDLNHGNRLTDEPPPPYWDKRMSHDENAIRASNDRQSVLINLLGKYGLWEEANRTLEFFDECLATYRQPSIPFSNDNKRIVLICHEGPIGIKLKIWDKFLRKEMPLQNSTFGMDGGAIIHGNGVVISPDGKYLAAVLEAQLAAIYPSLPSLPMGNVQTDLRIWDIDTGEEIKNFDLNKIASDEYKGVQLAFSPDGLYMAVAGRKLLIYQIADLVAKSK